MTDLRQEQAEADPVLLHGEGLGFATIPPGVHPGDASTATENVPGAPQDHEKGQQHSPGRTPWGTDNEVALPVFQRSAYGWGAGAIQIAPGGEMGGTAIIAPRQKGRQKVTVWCPSKMPNGVAPLAVLIAPDQASIQNLQAGAGTSAPGCFVLNPGDPVVVIETEGEVWAGIPGGAATAGVQYVVTTNPLGRGRGLSGS